MSIVKIRETANSLVKDRRGAAIVEYLIIVGLVAIICIFAYRQFGKAVKTKVDAQTTKVGGI